MRKKWVFVLIGFIGLSGCTGQGIQKEDIGSVLGAVGGGLLGAQFGGGTGQIAAAVGGSILGGLLGKNLGSYMDDADRNNADLAAQRSLTNGRNVEIMNQNTGNTVQFSSGRPFDSSGTSCREGTLTLVTKTGQKIVEHGKFCDRGGNWVRVN